MIFRQSLFLISLVSLATFGCKTKPDTQKDYNKGWQPLGPFTYTLSTAPDKNNTPTPHGIGKVSSIWINPKKPETMLAASCTGGLFATQNNGKQWHPLFPDSATTGVTSILVNPFNSKNIIVATGIAATDGKTYGYGIWESVNFGKTWNKNALVFQPGEYSRDIIQKVASSGTKRNQTLFATGNESIYSHKAKDKNFQRDTFFVGANFRHIATTDNQNSPVFICGQKLIRYQNAKYTDITSRLPLQSAYRTATSVKVNIAFSKKYPNRIYVLIGENNNLLHLAQSDDWGNTWTNMQVSLEKLRWDNNKFEIATLLFENKEYLFLGLIRSYLGDDNHKSFRQVTFPVNNSNYIHDDIRDIKILNNKDIYLAHDGGIGCSKDMCNTWENLSGNGLSITQFFGFDHSLQNPYFIVGGTLDMSSQIFKNNVWYNTWQLYGDGGRARISPTNDSVVVIGRNGEIFISKNAGASWISIQPPGLENWFGFDFPMLFSKDGKYLYVAGEYLWKYDVTKLKPVRISSGQPRHINTLDVQNDIIWMARKEATWHNQLLSGKLFVSFNGGQFWNDITNKLPILAWRQANHICINPQNTKTIAIGLDGFDNATMGQEKVYLTTDGGETFVNFSQGLPNVPVNCLEWIGDDLYAGTDQGVYMLKKDSGAFIPFCQNLPQTVITELHYHPIAKKLRASTFGRGIWEYSF